MRTRVVLLAAALVTGALSALPGSAAPGCAALTTTRTGATGEWRVYSAPLFPDGPQEVTTHATDRHRWFVTNGISVMGSQDSGCTWREVVRLPDSPTAEVPASRDTDRITQLAAAGGLIAASVFVLSEQSLPVIIEDPDGSPVPEGATVVLTGTTSLRAAAPLPVVAGRPGPLVVAPSTGRTLYAAVGSALNVSRDGGASWTPATPPTNGTRRAADGRTTFDLTPPAIGAVAVDPHDAQEVWAHVVGGVYGSSDGGQSWRRGVESAFQSRFPAVAIGSARGGAPVVTAAEQPADSGAVAALQVADGGSTFERRPTGAQGIGQVLGTTQSMVSGPQRDDLVLTTTGPSVAVSQTYFWLAPAGRLVRVDEFGLGPLSDARRAGPAFAFRTTDTLIRWAPDRTGLAGFVPPPVVLPQIGVGRIGAALPPLSPQTVLSSGVREVRLAPGGQERVPLRLDLSKEPTPLDVFFLVDTSGSMGDVVAGIAEAFADVARNLARDRIDVHYGLGDYQDTSGIRYRRLLDISPPGEPLRDALESIRTAGGSEPAYTALHQMATGTGIEDPPRGAAVPPGQDATWRPGSLRIVIHATDEVPSEDAAGATEGEAVRALKADGVRHIGLHVVRDQVASATGDRQRLFDPEELQDRLERLSQATGALAPPGGMDCNGDGRSEVAQGEPLVCQFVPGLLASRIELAGPLRRLLGQLVDLQTVDVAVEPVQAAQAFGARLVVQPPGQVDVKRPAQLDYVLQVTCLPQVYGQTRDLQLRPRVGKRVGAAVPLRVACDPVPGAPPGPPREFAFIAPVAPAVVVPALPPPPPPPPAPAAAPAPAPAPAAAGVTAPVPGVAVAPDEGQVQLAFVQQEAEQAGEQLELAMVAADREPDPAAIRLLPMLLVVATATAVALRRREAAQPRRTT